MIYLAKIVLMWTQNISSIFTSIYLDKNLSGIVWIGPQNLPTNEQNVITCNDCFRLTSLHLTCGYDGGIQEIMEHVLHHNNIEIAGVRNISYDLLLDDEDDEKSEESQIQEYDVVDLQPNTAYRYSVSSTFLAFFICSI